MARIAGVDLPREKRVEIGLTYIYGIGVASSNRILAEAKVDPNIRCKDLTDDDVKKISALFFLVCYCSLRTFSCSSVGLCFLTTNRKSFSVTDTTIASNLLKSLDVHSNFSS